MKKKTNGAFALHHVCGLIAGIFIIVITLAGTVLVFRDEIDKAQYAKEFKLATPAKELHIDKAFEAIRQANPGWEIRVPSFPKFEDQALKYELRQDKLRKWIFVHPETGEILSEVERADQRLVQNALLLHYTLFAGTPGKIVVMFVGLAFVILTITGFLLYRKSILKVLLFQYRVSTQNRITFFNSLHRVVGVWALLFNLLMSVTGTWYAYVQVEGALNKKNKAIETPALGMPVAAMLESVKAAYPDFQIKSLRFPTSSDGKLAVSGRLETDPAYYGGSTSSVQVDTQTGEVAKTDFMKDTAFGERAKKISQTLHKAGYGGTWLKVIYCIGGFLPGLLSVSGFVIWYFRKKLTQNIGPANRKTATV